MINLQQNVTIIKSQQGNGGTYMMNAIAKQLEGEGNLVCYLLAEQLSNSVKKDADRFARHLLNQSVVVVDDLDYLIRRNDLACMKWLKNLLHEFIGGGGRFMFSHTSIEMTVDDWLLQIGEFKATEIICSYPPFKTLNLIGKQYVPDYILNAHSEEAYRLSNNTRGFLNILISYKAKNQLALL